MTTTMMIRRVAQRVDRTTNTDRRVGVVRSHLEHKCASVLPWTRPGPILQAVQEIVE